MANGLVDCILRPPASHLGAEFFGWANRNRSESAFRSTRFHAAEAGHNAISVVQDAFFASWSTKQSSGVPRRSYLQELQNLMIVDV